MQTATQLRCRFEVSMEEFEFDVVAEEVADVFLELKYELETYPVTFLYFTVSTIVTFLSALTV